MGAWHLGCFRAEIPPGSHGDISLVLPDVAALSPMGMVAALTCHTSQHTAKGLRDGWGVLAAGDTIEIEGQDPPSALHFPAQLSGTQIFRNTMRCILHCQQCPLSWRCLQQTQAGFSGFC